MNKSKVPFLRSLKLRNFKSIQNCDIELAPLTILVGRNSSGKSTLIQSILLLAQNASSSDPRGLGYKGYLDINGSLVTLGQFSELINDRATKSDQQISIGCVFEFPIPLRGKWLESVQTNSEELPNEDVYLLSNELSNKLDEVKGFYQLELLTQFEENSNEYEKNLIKARISQATLSVNGFAVQEISGARYGKNDFDSELNIDEKYNRNFSSLVLTNSNLKSRKGVHIESRNYLVYPNRAEKRKLESTQFMLGVPITGLESMNALDIVMKHQNSLFSRPSSIASEIIRSSRVENSEGKKKDSNFTNQDVDRLFKDAAAKYAKQCIEAARTIGDLEWGSEEIHAIGQELLPWSALDIPIKWYLDDVSDLRGYQDESLGLYLSKEEMASAEAEHDFYLLSEIARELKPYQMTATQLATLRRSISSSIKRLWDEIKSQVNELKVSEQPLPNKLVPLGFALVEDMSEYDDDNYINTAVGFGANRFQEFLQRVCYLGPLRKAPTEIYERFSTPGFSQTPLGFEGERLGQLVFENPIAQYPIPVANSNSNEIITSIKNCGFREALNAWLLELGIAKVGIASIPESHYGLKVTVDGRPLRSLGVGVSQVIPVIATCLIAGQGSLVLLEEPELHLNPSLQRQLADFFIAMSLPGADRQLIIETHSEYLITRLRVHAVKSKEQASLMKLLFASQSMTPDSSFSSYQELIADENGEIPEWPELPGHEDGYFGQVPHDIQELLRILVERHKNSGLD